MKNAPNIVVVDYDGGNLASARHALEQAARNAGLKVRVKISSDAEEVRKADRIVLPGQGAFADCWAGLNKKTGLLEAIITQVHKGTPFLGICVGMQMMADSSHEHGKTPGFGWIRGDIQFMRPNSMPLPQMGWNSLNFPKKGHPLLDGLESGVHGYFVHSYALANYNADDIAAITDYDGAKVPAVVARDNVAGTQFHVEKSQQVGLQILANFLIWKPPSRLGD